MTKTITRAVSAALTAMLTLSLLPGIFAARETLSRSVADYTGAGSVIAVVGAGFAADHPVFAEAPPTPALTKDKVEQLLPGAYVSEKLAAVWDYADKDADVQNSSYVGTAAASLAAGRYTGKGDIIEEDNTVIHDASFAGSAPDAQLLLFKAAADYSVRIQPAAAAEAIRDAVLLGADAIWLDTEGLTRSDALLHSLEQAEKAGIPVLVGAGDVSAKTYTPKLYPITYTDRGTLTEWASAAGVFAVGAAADPYLNVTSFTLSNKGETADIPYTDSCPDYFGTSFASLTAGTPLRLVAVPGVGLPADYENIDAAGAVAVVLRGEIPFTEKALYASEAGAVALIVADNGSGLSRMALEGSPIPAVMVDTDTGALLLSLTEAEFSVPAAQPSRASFSAAGISEDLRSCPAFLCEAQRITAAIPAAANDENSLYATLSGTAYAAASGAGYIARAAEYSRAAGLKNTDALALALSSAQQITDEEGDMLSPREAGCGLLSANGFYGLSALSASDGSTVSLPGDLLYSSAVLSLRMTNTTAQRQRYTVTVSMFSESTTEGEDGTALLTGTLEPLTESRAYMGDSYVNICQSSSAGNAGVISLDPGETAEFTVRVTVTSEARRALLAEFWNGFFADGAVTVTDAAGDSVHHPFSLFYGEWDSSPLCDVTIYDGDAPTLYESRLYVHRFDEDGQESMLPLGAVNPYTSMTEFHEEYNLVNPAFLRYGWVELELYALRDIDHIDITFYDAERHTLIHRTAPGIQKYLTGGAASIPLWDFIAMDEPDYLFPDGDYSCEIRLSSSFGDAGDAVQYLGFTFRVDSEKPQVKDVQVYTENGLIYLTAEVEDNEALLDIAVYDTVFSYGVSSRASIAGEKNASVTFDVSRYDALGPLYIEVTDRTGSYSTIRLSPEKFEEMLLQATGGEAP